MVFCYPALNISRDEAALYNYDNCWKFIQPALIEQQKLATGKLLQLVKEAYIYGYPVEQSYYMYVTLPDNAGKGSF